MDAKLIVGLALTSALTFSGLANEPCRGEVGKICAGKIVFAGELRGGKYMLMPAGCEPKVTEPNCDGSAKTLRLSWDDAMSFCESLILGGYSDWYLPSAVELGHIYCNSDGGAPGVNQYPQSDPGCRKAGNTDRLLGFSLKYPTWAYWSRDRGSTSKYRKSTNFGVGEQWESNKKSALNVRCVRRFL